MSARDFLLQLAVAIIAAAVVLALGHAILAVAVVVAVILAMIWQQQRVINSIQKDTRVTVGMVLTADTVLAEAEAADKIAAAAEEGFRLAAQRRVAEKERGRDRLLNTGVSSGTFEHTAMRHVPEWNRRFEELSAKLFSFGFKTAVPGEPSNKIDGLPSVEGTKLICEREALDVAADALRATIASIASDARQSRAEPKSI